MRTRYATARRIALLERRMSDRDQAIVATLDRVRAATTAQIRQLHFSDLKRSSAARQAPEALRRLASLGVVTSLDRQVGGVRAGSQATVWVLDLVGQKLASGAGPAGGSIRRPWMPGIPFLAHRLAITELYVDLVETERTDAIKLIDFEAEPFCWRRYAAPHGGYAHLKPDAFVRVVSGVYERGTFVEIDCGTESPPTLARKCRAYRAYWESGREQQRRGYFPQVVFAVPSEARKAVLVDVCRRQPEEAWPLFRPVLRRDALAALSEGSAG